ncbi:MAG TPA: biotin carboxylase N-terminal domain-containing protein [Pseudobdellovibrionaceae bacterium]|nr:biotin carboxylase N-terminal domain-containing protein [Pseudobdellovibrionaceae bacterium]
MTKDRRIQKLAIANRGEVAVRIIHACRELGIRSVLLHSEADQATRAWRMADERVCIGPAASAESYLNVEACVRGARAGGADAVHPGFGFLSENAGFARAVIDAGMIWVGPPADAIEAAGDKISAKKLVADAQAPTVPGYMGEDQRIDTLVEEAARIGFPVIVKAAAGGGGRGMKVIRSRAEAPELIASAQREGQAAFGSPVVFLEKYLDRAKHIEVQVFGDFTGQVSYLMERECSVQRRHQKIIEEALSPSLTPELRRAMGEAAVRLAEKANYESAGTVEFLLQDEKFYFLEMNTRLQVEHPVTEMVLGVDLVKAQILNAARAFQVWPQESLVARGHAIECRIYAEDAYAGGLPSTGRLLGTHWPEGPGRRFEVGVEAGDEVTPFYDPMIAKVIVWDESRLRAIRKMQSVLTESVVMGVETNIPFLKEMLAHPEFTEGRMTTQFVGQHFPEGLASADHQARRHNELTRAFASFAKTKISRGATTGSPMGSEDPTRAVWSSPWRLM